MESHRRPIRELAETLRSFVGTMRSQLLHITVDDPLRESAIDVAMGFEHHADNFAPFFRLESVHPADGSGWDAALEQVRSTHAKRRAAMAETGLTLEALPSPSTAPTPLARFGATLASILDALCPPLRGALIVLAPAHVEAPAAFERDLAELTSRLPRVRWILVERSTCSIGAEVARATHATHARAVVDEDEACRELEAKLDAAERAPTDAPSFAQNGAAWPRGVLPPGADGSATRRAASVAKVAASLGLPAALFSHALKDLRSEVLRGALAMRRRDPLAAATHQGRAARAALEAGLGREATLMEMLLASYLVAAQQRPAARDRYQACADRALAEGWYDLAAQSLMAIGSTHLIDRDPSAASVAYGWAGRAARDGEHRALAIEGFRMAGQCAAEDDNRDVAGRLFTEALGIASPLDDADAGRTSAPVAARQLADVFERLGSAAQARSLREQADRMDAAARGEEAAA